MGKRLGRRVSLGIVSILLLGGTAWTAPLDGPTVYEGACESCHGADGRGSPEGTALTVPLPDFTDCSFSSREPTSTWTHVIANGGAFMSLSDQMPAFGGVLSPEEIQTVLAYVRNFCQEQGWPSGDLNFRQPLFTAKAFPENEAVLKQEFIDGQHGTQTWTTTLSYERRLGARGQWELSLPYTVKETRDRTTAGPGDLALSYKHVLSAHTAARAITAAALEVVLPSGDRDRGLGDGTFTFEPSLLSGIALRQFVFQNQVQAVLPLDADRAERQMRYRLAGSYLTSSFKRGLVPSLEIEFRHDLQDHSDEVLLLTPQLYTGLRFRGHVALRIGTQIPVAGTEPFDYRIGAALVWDYLDGELW